MTYAEVSSMAELYLNEYWDKYMLAGVREEYFDKHFFVQVMKRPFVNEIYKCAVLDNFYWAVWAIKMIEDPTEQGNYEFAQARVEAQWKLKEIFLE